MIFDPRARDLIASGAAGLDRLRPEAEAALDALIQRVTRTEGERRDGTPEEAETRA